MTFIASKVLSAAFVVAALGRVLFVVIHRVRSNRSISSNGSRPLTPEAGPAPQHDLAEAEPEAAAGRRPVAAVVTPLVPEAKTEPSDPAPYPGKFHVRYWHGPDGRPASSENKAAWLEARRTGVTATDARKLANPDGHVSEQRAELLASKLNGDDHEQGTTDAMQYGLDREAAIAAWVLQEFGIEHNTFLCRGVNGRHLATPDGIGDGVICEIKTSTRSWHVLAESYRDQLQWQLHVTSSAWVLFVVENRDTHVIEWGWVDRDEARIAVLVRHADLFLAELDSRR